MEGNLLNITPEEKQGALARVADTFNVSVLEAEDKYGKYILNPACISVGKRMKRLRETSGMSLEDVASKTSCSPEVLGIVEEGLIPPGSKLSLGFADLFNFPWHQVFGEIKDVVV